MTHTPPENFKDLLNSLSNRIYVEIGYLNNPVIDKQKISFVLEKE